MGVGNVEAIVISTLEYIHMHICVILPLSDRLGMAAEYGKREEGLVNRGTR